MAKTGESYTSARRQLIAGGDQPDPGTPTFEPMVADDRMIEATGHGHDGWFARLDTWGGTDHTHTEIARWLVEDQGVPGWWAQSITVSYERARGMRARGQMADGWSITASKTLSVAVDALFDAFEAKGPQKATVHVSHERLPDADTAEAMKAYWRSALVDLKAQLESEET